jgi:hypothetical protein
MPELQQLLWQAVQFGSETTAATAVDLWLADPATRSDRAAEVLKLDASAALLPRVSRTITTQRTDLLDPVLDITPPHGRFLPRDSRRPQPPVGPGTVRWLPRQQRAAASLLAREAGDETCGMEQRRAALRRLADIPGDGLRELRLWANDPVEEESQLADTALAATVRTDRPDEALPLLLEHARDGRAHVAVPALARAARHADSWRLPDVLQKLLLSDTPEQAGDAAVACRKATVRVAVDCLPLAEAAELLLQVYAAPNQHPEVKAACVACAPRLLDDDHGWEIAESAAQGMPALRHALLRVHPFDLPNRHRERYARLLTGLGHADDQGVTEAVYAALPAWAPWASDAADVLSAAVTDLADRSTWRQAAEGLVELVITLPGAARTLEQVLSGLIDADSDPDTPDALADRDRPARRRVEHLTRTLGEAARRRPVARRAAGRTGVLLADYEEFVPLAAQLLCTAVTLEGDPDTLGRQLRGIAGLHRDRPGLAWRTANDLRCLLGPMQRPAETRERVLPVARELATDGGTATGLLAVTLAAVVNPNAGAWPEPWRALLRTLRHHPTPDVRAAALDLATHPGE